jgi:hypothetical protein
VKLNKSIVVGKHMPMVHVNTVTNVGCSMVTHIECHYTVWEMNALLCRPMKEEKEKKVR